MQYKAIAIIVIPLFLVVGCATTPQSYTTTTTPMSTNSYTLETCSNWLANIPEKHMIDKVLWQDRLAMEALRQGDWDLARETFDDVLTTLGGVHASDPQARKARSYFHPESSKNFLGEPYEICSAYFFRGIIYWKDGDLDNARACFRSVEFDDTYTETNNKYAGDWVLPDYLDALATTKLGSDGSDAIKRLELNNHYHALLPINTNANVVVFIESGRGPIKYSTGQYHEELRILSGNATLRQTYLGNRMENTFIHNPASTNPPMVNLIFGGETNLVYPADDLYFQASTRGGRLMDHILQNKVVFKKGANTAGDILLTAAVLSAMSSNNNSGAGIAAGAFLVLGLTAKIISAATTPAADTRCWDDLPQYLYAVPLQLPPGNQTISVQFFDPAGGIVAQKMVSISVPDGNKDTALFVSDRSTP